MNFKLSKSNWPRLLFQWGVIIYIAILAIISSTTSIITDFEAYCPFGGIQALGSFFINNSLTCSMTSVQIIMGIFMMVGVFLFSKLFCSYICPIGTITEWFSKLGTKLKIEIKMNRILDKVFRSLKYILLFITLYYTFDSSELFCKKFDPFYAVTSGFDYDVVILWAALAIFIVIIGSVFIKMFWCKYICPFGALANIFKFTGFFVLVLAIYIALLKFGMELNYVWPLTFACLGGYIIEISKFKIRFFPIAKITRNEDSCTNCQLCTINCPQSIDVANTKVVRDADCNLCVECVTSCPEKNTLQVNNRNKLKWLPPVSLAIMIVLGLYIGSFFEIPTIDQRWYDASEMKDAKIYKRSGLKSIKCFGSCTVFANQMHQIKGVMGVSAFVGTKTVKIYYDPKIINETQIEKAIFTPMKSPIRTLAKDARDLQIVSIKLDQFFDTSDFSYLCRLLQQKTKVVGVETVFGCPVVVNMFIPADVLINEEELTKILESKELTYKIKDGSNTVKLTYVVKGDYSYKPLTKADYVRLMFKPYEAEFARKKNYTDDVIGIFRVAMGKNKSQVKNLKYLGSHLYDIDEVLGVRNLIDTNLQQVLEIQYIDSLTTGDKILELLNCDTLRFSYSSGKKGTVKNMFNFIKSKK